MLRLILLVVVLACTGCVQRIGDEPEIFQIVRDNDAASLASLLENGADPNLKNGVGDALIYVAAGPKGGPDVVSTLLTFSADPDAATSNGRTALHNAAGWCTQLSVQILLQGGANPHLKADDGKTALDSTCLQPVDNRVVVIQLLRDAMSK